MMTAGHRSSPTSSLCVNGTCAPTFTPSSFLKRSCNKRTSQSVSIEICNRKMSVESSDSPATPQLNTSKVTGSVAPFDRPETFPNRKTFKIRYCLQYPRLHLHDDRDPSRPSKPSPHILTSFIVDSLSRSPLGVSSSLLPLVLKFAPLPLAN